MNIVDILIIIFILLGAVVGFKQGFTKSLVSFVGIVIVTILAYFLKNPVSEFLMSFCPFFSFGGIIKGITVLNIAVYEVIAFLLVFAILMIVLRALLFATGILETILKFTIVLGIPSKILGAIVGVIKNYIIAFFVLYLLSMPNFVDVEFVKDSKFREPILRNTPLLSNAAEGEYRWKSGKHSARSEKARTKHCNQICADKSARSLHTPFHSPFWKRLFFQARAPCRRPPQTDLKSSPVCPSYPLRRAA